MLFHFDDYDDTSQESVIVCKLAAIVEELLESAHMGNGLMERLCICVHAALLCIRLIVIAVSFACETYHPVYFHLQMQ